MASSGGERPGADQLLADVATIIRKTFRQPGAEIARETTAMDVDGWDSLSHTVLILAVESHFGMQLPSDRMFELADVGELVDLIMDVRKRGG